MESCAGRKLVLLLSVRVGIWIAAVYVLGWVLWVFLGLLFGVVGGGGICCCVGMGVFGWV